MGLSKQEQLDLFAGNVASEEDSSDADDLQDLQLGISKAIQASNSHNQTVAAFNGLHASDLSTSRADSSNHDCACSGHDQSVNPASAIRAQETSDDDTEAESSWSDSDFSSDSGSGSEASDSEGGDDDPETSPPIKVH